MIIELKAASSIVEDTEILHAIDWVVRPGEHWAVLGVNGSGKTSLLNLINGYVPLSSGEMRVLGRRYGAYDWRVLRKSIGFVSSSLQERFYGGETAGEIVLSGIFSTIGLYDSPRRKDLAMARGVLERLNCGRLAGHRYDSLSQGEKQKVLIARALVGRPKLLIMDEPANGLDFFAREELLEGIGALAGTNPPATAPLTLVYVTHYLEEILPVFTHVLLLKSGRMHSAGEAAKILTARNLTSFFGVPVALRWRNRRAWLEMK
ncbi:MAG: ABC transporter ATP-binding protein [Nitrospiraceae bacterium]|nr:ABC transporter ATP-binding protein [Nitrospiraceae bacterium]